MLSLDLCQILPLKNAKVQISSKILPQILKLANFVKNQYYHHDGQFSSFCPFFVKKEILWSITIRHHSHTRKYY